MQSSAGRLPRVMDDIVGVEDRFGRSTAAMAAARGLGG